MNDFKHLSLWERQRIERYIKAKQSLHFIAGELGRSLSSLSVEVKMNRVKGKYVAQKAHHKAYVKRRQSKLQCLKVAMDKDLKQFVTENILADQSPQGISGRLREVVTDIEYASPKAIYKFVSSVHGRQIEKHLYAKAVKKRGGPKHKKPVGIDGRTMIDERPQQVDSRREFGHYEGDFIESGRDGRGSLLVLVERKTRYPFLKYLEDRTTENVNGAIRKMLGDSPIESLTIDNDLSFQKHRELSELIEAAVFFCHPQSPHEKGTVENRNKAIRRYVPKRSDLSQFSLTHFQMVEQILRHKFMKCLDYLTPREAWERELKKLTTKKPRRGGMMKNELLARGCSD